jgi:rod shape-determining protein MreC
MALGADRYATRGDTLVFLSSLALSLVAMSLPPTIRDSVASGLRRSVLWPLLQLQEQSEALRTSHARFVEVSAERDSAVLAAAQVQQLRSENAQLRDLLGLRGRLGTAFVPAEVLHQAAATDRLTLVISAGTRQGVRPLAAVVTSEGLLGFVSNAESVTSVVATWAHPDFRASGMAADGSVYGIVSPRGSSGPGGWLLQLDGVPYRQRVPVGSVVLTSGLGGVLPRGIPIGSVIGEITGENDWERTYLIRPAVPPGAATHVMVLTQQIQGGDLRSAFAPDSARGRRQP